MVRKADRIWALYKGDSFIASGTVAEIAKITGKSYDHLIFMTYPSYKKRKDYGNRMQMEEMESDLDD